MKLIDFKNKIAGTLFAIALLFGIGLVANITVEAQYRNDRYQRNRDRDYRDQRRRDRDNDWRNNNWRRGRYNDGYPDLGGSFNLRQTALNAGANEGIRAGRVMTVDVIVLMSFEMRAPFKRRPKTTVQDSVTGGYIKPTSDKHSLMRMLTGTAVTNPKSVWTNAAWRR